MSSGTAPEASSVGRRNDAGMIRILLADDHRVVRDALRVLLDAQPGMCVVGDVADGREALRQARRLQPDVAIMDIAMPVLNGIEATLQLHDTCPGVRVLVLSMHSSTPHVFRALQAGAMGYLLKDSAGSDVVAAVREVHAGRRYLSQ
jgi:DNA-binding NarL/FixJ family response regulator